MSKLTAFIFILSCSYGLNSLANISSNYDKSSSNDLSFESRWVIHETELEALSNYFINFNNGEDKITELYSELLLNLTVQATKQTLFMSKGTMDADSWRKTKDELMLLGEEDVLAYLEAKKKVEAHYSITKEEFEKITVLINSVKVHASFQLEESLNLLQDYLGLAYDLHYTKLEMFQDMTGYENPVAAATAYINPFSEREEQGLAANEAIRKLEELEDYTPEFGLNKSTVNLFKAYPNPVNIGNEVFFTLNLEESDKVTINVVDVTGKLVYQMDRNYGAGLNRINWDLTDISNNKVNPGMYLIKVKTSEKEELAKIFVTHNN